MTFLHPAIQKRTIYNFITPNFFHSKKIKFRKSFVKKGNENFIIIPNIFLLLAFLKCYCIRFSQERQYFINFTENYVHIVIWLHLLKQCHSHNNELTYNISSSSIYFYTMMNFCSFKRITLKMCQTLVIGWMP